MIAAYLVAAAEHPVAELAEPILVSDLASARRIANGMRYESKVKIYKAVEMEVCPAHARQPG